MQSLEILKKFINFLDNYLHEINKTANTQKKILNILRDYSYLR